MKKLNLLIAYSLIISLLINGMNNDTVHQQKVHVLLDLLGNNQSDKLKACKDLACVEQLLRAKEEKATEKAFDVFEVALEKREKYYTRTKNIAARHHEELLTQTRKDVIHDECVGKQNMQLIKDLLAEHNINPYALNIGCGEQYFLKNPTVKAVSLSGLLSNENSWSKYIKPGIIVNTAKKLSPHDFAHEIIHQLEAHSTKRIELKKVLINDEDTSYFKKEICLIPDEKCLAYRTYERTQETIAQLFPSIKDEKKHNF